MLKVKIPKDLREIKPKIIFNLTKRQLICFSIAALVGVPIYLLLKDIIGTSGAGVVMVIVMLPFFFLAMFERDGLPLEKILTNYISFLRHPKVYIYQTENMFREAESLPAAIKEGKQSEITQRHSPKRKIRT